MAHCSAAPSPVSFFNPMSLPWFIRAGDRLVNRYERWATEMRSSPEFYSNLLRYATTREEATRAWLAEALSRYDYVDASRFRKTFVLLLVIVAPLMVAGSGLRGLALILLLSLCVPFLGRLDRWNRRRLAWAHLADGVAEIYTKVRVKPPAGGSNMFQSYWTIEGIERPVELDHPMELLDAVTRANEWWQWRMPVPAIENGRRRWRTPHLDVGLVHRDAAGERSLLAGGVVYFSYDPWAAP